MRERECFRVFQCARMCVCVRVHGIVLWNCANAQARIYAGVCVYVCVCVCMCVYVCMCA